MIYTPLTRKALNLAYGAHQNQKDRSGVPYIFHPYHLAEQMDDEISCAVALLHDVVEDTTVTLANIRQEFPQEVADAVALLTHHEDADYFEYVRNIKSDPIAKKVKLADIAHNSDVTRLDGTGISKEKLDYWREKYEKAKEILEQDVSHGEGL